MSGKSKAKRGHRPARAGTAADERVTVRFTVEENALIAVAAGLEDKELSKFIRDSAISWAAAIIQAKGGK